MDIERIEDLNNIRITNKKLLSDLATWDFFQNGEIRPEGRTRIAWIQKLHNEYHYDWKQMEIEVPMEQIGRNNTIVRADLVVYRDTNFNQNFDWSEWRKGIEITQPHPKPLIVFEFKSEGITEQKEQAEGYAQKLNAEFWGWSNGIENHFYRTRYQPQKSELMPDLPHMIGNKPLPMRLPKTVPLTPFKDEHEVRNVFERIRKIIIGEGKISIFLFNDLSTILKLKIYDERATPYNYDFTVLSGESDVDVFNRVKNLYQKGQKDEKFLDLLPETKFKFSPNALKAIVTELMRYDFVETMRSVEINDILGIVYEEIVGESFRGDLGQHFTPRELVNFLTDIIDFDANDKIFDPACGSGGFLIFCIKKYREKLADEFPNLSASERESQVKDFAEKNLFGLDIDANMVNIAKTNMYLHGDGHSGVSKGNFLDGLTYDKKLREHIDQGKINIILTNPPFNDNGDVKFIRNAIEILPPDGILATVVSDGTLNNKPSSDLRDLIRTQTEIICVVSLPQITFDPYGSGAKTSLIILRKKNNPFESKRMPVFMAIADDIGYNYKNRRMERTGRNDLIDIAKNYKLYKEGKQPQNTKHGFNVPLHKLKDSLAAQNNYQIDFKCFVQPLGEVADVLRLPSTPHSDQNSIIYFIERIDSRKGEIIFKISTLADAPKGAVYKLPKGCLVINRIAAHEGGVSIVPEHLDGILATNEYIALTPKENITTSYLFNYLRGERGREIISLKRTGSRGGGRLMLQNLLQIPIPIPSDKDYHELIEIERNKEALTKQLSLSIQSIEIEEKKIMEGYWK